jgi:hypothetical protein
VLVLLEILVLSEADCVLVVCSPSKDIRGDGGYEDLAAAVEREACDHVGFLSLIGSWSVLMCFAQASVERLIGI